jgi:hypothetical protein
VSDPSVEALLLIPIHRSEGRDARREEMAVVNQAGIR